MRYGAITPAAFCTPHSDLEAWRTAVAAAEHPVVGDRPHCEGPTACMWVCGVRVVRSTPSQSSQHQEEMSGALLFAACGPPPPNASPERFAKILAREAAVCERVDAGTVTSAYVQRMVDKQ